MGARALAENGDLDNAGIDELIHIVAEMRPKGTDSDIMSKNAMSELAIVALGKTHATAAAPVLIEVVSRRDSDYWREAWACRALARIGFTGAVPALEAGLASPDSGLSRPDFRALPDAFRALITLGDRNAVPLAISAMTQGPDQDLQQVGLVKQLEKVTGRHFGSDRQAWREWWRSVDRTWNIPSGFRKPFDDQPPLY